MPAIILPFRYRAWKLEENAQSAARAAAKEPQQLAQQQGAQQHVAKQHQLAQQHQVQHQQYSLPTAFASNNISYSQQSGSACEGQLYGGRGGGVGGRAVGTGASEWRKGAPAAAAAAKAGTPHTGKEISKLQTSWTCFAAFLLCPAMMVTASQLVNLTTLM